jgi:hypothetical protein
MCSMYIVEFIVPSSSARGHMYLHTPHIRTTLRQTATASSSARLACSLYEDEDICVLYIV